MKPSKVRIHGMKNPKFKNGAKMRRMTEGIEKRKL